MTRIRVGIVTMMCGLAYCVGPRVGAAVIEHADKTEWQSSVGEYTTIDFTGFPDGTKITDQYADLGVLFGSDIIAHGPSFQDGAGLHGVYPTPIEIWFDEPVTSVATDFLGDLLIELYSGDELIYTSSYFGYFSKFGGVVSTEPFDGVKILDPSDFGVVIDNLYFGPPIPGPSALALLGVAFAGTARQRRQYTALLSKARRRGRPATAAC